MISLKDVDGKEDQMHGSEFREEDLRKKERSPLDQANGTRFDH